MARNHDRVDSLLMMGTSASLWFDCPALLAAFPRRDHIPCPTATRPSVRSKESYERRDRI